MVAGKRLGDSTGIHPPLNNVIGRVFSIVLFQVAALSGYIAIAIAVVVAWLV